MPIISAVGLFCYDEFEETPNEKVVNMSKLTKPNFNKGENFNCHHKLLKMAKTYMIYNFI